MGEKIPVQILGLPPYNLYLFAIHQTPSSLCISRTLIYRICRICFKQQGEGTEIGFTSDLPTLQMFYITLIFPIQWNTLKWAEGICSLGTLLRCWSCQRCMHTPKMLWHPMQRNVLEVGRSLFKYCRIMGFFHLFGTVVVIFSGSFSYISVEAPEESCLSCHWRGVKSMKRHFTEDLAKLVSPVCFGWLLCFGCHVTTLLSLDLNGPLCSPPGQPLRVGLMGTGSSW